MYQAEGSSIGIILKTILDNYLKVKESRYSSKNIIGSSFLELKEEVSNILSNKYPPNLSIKYSYGKGNWSTVPWLAILEPNRSKSIQDGVDVVFLFKEDMSGVYLTLNQGITKVMKKIGKEEGKKFLKESAEIYRTSLSDEDRNQLEKNGFHLNDNVIYAKSGIGTDYQPGTIINKFYESKDILTVDIISDLHSLLDIYLKIPEDLIAARVDISEKSNNYNDRSTRNEGQRTNPHSALNKEDTSTSFMRKLTEEPFTITPFLKSLKEANFHFDELFISRFVASLMAKKFAILTGLSGSGKTKLALLFSQWISENQDHQVCLVPVGADWTNREPLLGFTNGLLEGSYVKPDNGVLDLLLESSKNPSKPFFLILDEMNLSHVERYFADFLSAIETGEKIFLHPTGPEWKEETIPPSITIPDNFFIIGTVNVDETTYMFSPKVLDRAFVHEFRVSSTDMHTYLQEPKTVDTSGIPSKGARMAKDFLTLSNSLPTSFNSSEQLIESMLTFFDELKLLGHEFGYRTASEILKFGVLLNNSKVFNLNIEMNNIIDAAVVTKLLPKVHGSRRKLERTLISLFKLCFQSSENEDINDYMSWKKSVEGNENVKFPISLGKVVQMYRQIIQNGFTSFSEA